MRFKKNFKDLKIQKNINNLAKKLKNKKILIYGAGEFSEEIFKNYDLSKLNIIGVVDKKFENIKNSIFYGYKAISPDKIINNDFDIILIANADFDYFKKIVKKFVGENVKILPLIKFSKIKTPFKFIYNIIYMLKIQEIFVEKLINNISIIMTLFIHDDIKKEVKRHYIKKYLRTHIYGYQVLEKARKIGSNFYCGGYSAITVFTTLKDYVHFNGIKIVGGGNVLIGNHFHAGTEILIITQNHNYDSAEAIPYDETYIYKDIVIDDFVWIGSRVTILPGTKIGEGAIIQGGSVVHGEIPPYSIAGGNPAKVFKYRNIEKFKKLKAENKIYFY